MTPLKHIVEPGALWLTWQPTDEHAPDRTRRIVGQLLSEGGETVFRYLRAHSDFIAAKDAGFKGHPAFDLRQTAAVGSAAIEPFLRRLPPRSREDFREYLEQYLLPYPFPRSDVALLGYTGARLPSDGFAFLPAFSAEDVPVDFLIEVAGVRHVFRGDVSAIHLGDTIELRHDEGNSFDGDAVAVYWGGSKLGFVPRVLSRRVLDWVRRCSVRCDIARVNGRPERPLIYVRVQVT